MSSRIQIVLLRHGVAEDHSDTGLDADRKLTDEGRSIIRREAEFLLNRGISFDAILTSPYPRAYETAEILAAYFSLSPLVRVDNRMTPGFDMGQLIEIVTENPSGRSLLFVGHNPDLSEIVNRFCGAQVNLKKGGIAILEVYSTTPGGSILKCLLTPAIMGVKRLPFTEISEEN